MKKEMIGLLALTPAVGTFMPIWNTSQVVDYVVNLNDAVTNTGRREITIVFDIDKAVEMGFFDPNRVESLWQDRDADAFAVIEERKKWLEKRYQQLRDAGELKMMFVGKDKPDLSQYYQNNQIQWSMFFSDYPVSLLYYDTHESYLVIDHENCLAYWMSQEDIDQIFDAHEIDDHPGEPEVPYANIGLLYELEDPNANTIPLLEVNRRIAELTNDTVVTILEINNTSGDDDGES